MSLSDVPDDHGNSMDGALNQESREPGSKPSTAIDSLCDLRRRSLHSGLQLPHLTGRIGPDKFSTQSLSALTFGGVTQWTKLKTATPTTPPPLLFLVLSVLNLSVNAGVLWWPGLHCTAFQRFWVECKSTSILTGGY